MLLEITKLLKERKRMSLREISVHFDVPVDALEPMLEQLVKKGHAHVLNIKGCTRTCAGCFCADRDQMIVYECE
jgi:hypothetical protein